MVVFPASSGRRRVMIREETASRRQRAAGGMGESERGPIPVGRRDLLPVACRRLALALLLVCFSSDIFGQAKPTGPLTGKLELRHRRPLEWADSRRLEARLERAGDRRRAARIRNLMKGTSCWAASVSRTSSCPREPTNLTPFCPLCPSTALRRRRRFKLDSRRARERSTWMSRRSASPPNMCNGSASAWCPGQLPTRPMPRPDYLRRSDSKPSCRG